MNSEKKKILKNKKLKREKKYMATNKFSEREKKMVTYTKIKRKKQVYQPCRAQLPLSLEFLFHFLLLHRIRVPLTWCT